MRIVAIVGLIIILGCNSCNEQGSVVNRSDDATPTTLIANAEIKPAKQNQMFSDPSTESILAALKETGIHIYTINLPKIDLEKYKLIIHRETYINGVKSIHPAYPKIESLKATTYTNAQNQYNLVFTIIDKNETQFIESWLPPTGSRTTFTDSKDKAHFLNYNVTPFRSQEIIPGKKIPVLLYGSSWKDEKTGYLRYCMERELEPDFSSIAFDKMPGYYVYSIELKALK